MVFIKTEQLTLDAILLYGGFVKFISTTKAGKFRSFVENISYFVDIVMSIKYHKIRSFTRLRYNNRVIITQR